MKCKLCGNFFVEETAFVNVFQFEEICYNCKQEFIPKLKTEFIPIDNGVIEYNYFFEAKCLDLQQQSYLSIKSKYIYETILNQRNNFNLVIYIDNYEFETLPNWISTLKEFKKILFVSLVYLDFSRYYNIF